MEDTKVSVSAALFDTTTGEILDDALTLDGCPEGVDQLLWNMFVQEEEARKDPFLHQLHRAVKGQNVGLGNGLKEVNKYIYGTHKARYYLIGAESGVGKTTVADFMYVINAWLEAKKQKRKITIYYCSFEIGRTDKLYRWASYFIFVKYGVRLPSDYLQGRIPGKPPSREHVAMVLDAYKTITEMLQDVKILDHVLHPTGIFAAIIEQHFEVIGKVKRKSVSKEDAAKGVKGDIIGYEEDDPGHISVLVIDHMALTGTEMKLETKGIMDKLSRYCIVLRNLFHMTIVPIQQFSTDMMSSYRGMLNKKEDPSAITPTRLDFGDSKATYRDADVVFGLVKPQREMDKFYGIDISRKTGLGECFVAGYLMKNRYGPAARMFSMFLDGITGTVYDLPNTVSKELYHEWYEKAQQIEQLCQVFSPRVD